MTSAIRTEKTRLAALDGLRGIACLVVLLHHCLLSTPVFAEAYFHGTASRTSQSLGEYLFTWSPLHLLWEGTGAVWTFFVLSGFVLTRQALTSSRFTWRAYYPQRVIRLYVPVAAAVILASVVVTIFGNADHGATVSEWIARRSNTMTSSASVHDLTLLFGAGGGISPLWSLQWEMWFSLLLPLFVFVVRARRGVTARLALLLAPIAAYAIVVLGGGSYLAVFLVGAVLAGVHDRLGSAVSALRHRPWTARALVLVAIAWVVVILPARWTLWAWHLPGDVTMILSVSAAAVLVVLALYFGPVRRALSGRFLLWAGAISFSLYLVHEPIVVAFAKIFHGGALWVALPVAAGISFGLAALFRRFIEAPTANLARAVGRRIAGWEPVTMARKNREMMLDIEQTLRRAEDARRDTQQGYASAQLLQLGSRSHG